NHARDTLVYMGDGADLSCAQEYDRFWAIVAAAGAEPLLMMTSNHDGFFAGNYTQRADADGKLEYTDMPDDWRRACAEPGSMDDHTAPKAGGVVKIAAALPGAPAWATDMAAVDPRAPSGYRGAYLSYTRPIGDDTWGLFFDTVDYRDFDLPRSLGAG